MVESAYSGAHVRKWFFERRHALILAAIVSTSLLIRLHVSRYCSLWYDEVSTRADAYKSWAEVLRGPSRESPPLMFWLVRLVTEIFGTGDTAVRSVSLAFGCVLIVAVYQLFRELEFSPIQSLVAPACIALAPFFVQHATEARHYAIFGALIVLATVFAVRLLRRPFRLATLYAFAACTVAAGAIHFFALAYAMALWGALAVGSVRRWQFRALPERERARLVGVLAVSMLLLVVLGWRMLWPMSYYQTHSHGAAHQKLDVASVWQAFSFFARPRFPRALEVIVSALGLTAIFLRRRDIAGIIPLSLAFAPIACASLLSSGHELHPRYLSASFVFYGVGVVAAFLVGIELLARAAARSSALASPAIWGVGLVVLLAAFVARAREYPAGFVAGKYNYRGLQSYLRRARSRDTALVVWVDYQGMKIMGLQYPVPHLMPLNAFEPIPGIERYLVAEFPASSKSKMAQLGPLLKKHFGITLADFRKLPLFPLPRTRLQPAARARLVTFGENARRPEEPTAGEREAPEMSSDTGSVRDDDSDHESEGSDESPKTTD